MPSQSIDNSVPRVGMLAIIRKRRAVIHDVNAFSGDQGVLHLVKVDYRDEHLPESEQLIWELEPARQLLSPLALPQPSSAPMNGNDFDAIVRSARWSAISPYLDPNESGPLDRMPVSAPFHGAVQVEDYQMVPLLKALRMPRISMMIADDVGLGKTIEAGLILRELLIRRRIQRVLILTPASLRLQWKDEMWSKFSLRFDVIDRDSTQKLRRTIGIDANPWRTNARAISSYHYLKQPDVLEQFRSACRVPDDSPHLPWDLLIVDEVHNLMPSSFGDDSDLCKMLRMIAPYFEHRIFLTATPHNGKTRSFSGLLELLDPVRFSQTDELRPAERERIQQVVVRRLKREINLRTNPPKFCHRLPPKALNLEFAPSELSLIKALDAFRSKLRLVMGQESKKRRISGTFAIEILGKRLLSGPATFADSWNRCKLGLADDEVAADSDVLAAKKSVDEDTADDREAQQRGSTASTVVGSWLRYFQEPLKQEILDIDTAVHQLGFRFDAAKEVLAQDQDPKQDARFEQLLQIIGTLLRDRNQWRSEEKLVVFTEYKTTLEYLLRRLRKLYPNEPGRFLALFGGMDDSNREQIKEQFNDPLSEVRILVATDAASEGLNLQETARYLLHYDCPWNPSRIEQRNGRLDRHGQLRDVQTFHYASEQDADVRFLSMLISRVDQIREDLGAVGVILDDAVHRRLIEGEDNESVQADLERRIEIAKKSAELESDSSIGPPPEQIIDPIEALAREIDLDGDAQHQTLDCAMSMQSSSRAISPRDSSGCCKLMNPSLTGWAETIDDSVRRPSHSNTLGPLPLLAFDHLPFMETVGDRTVYRSRPHIQRMHLGHPLMVKALGALTRRRFPGPAAVSRWTVKQSELPARADALIVLHLEEIGVNELRETFHHWIRTIVFPVHGDTLGELLPHRDAYSLREAQSCNDKAVQERARNLFSELEIDMTQAVKSVRQKLTKDLMDQLKLDGQQAVSEEQQRYQSRQGEISALIADNTVEKLEKVIERLKKQKLQGLLFNERDVFEEIDKDIAMKREEVDRRKIHYEEIRKQLTSERQRILQRLLPKRYTLAGESQVFPLAVEIWMGRSGKGKA